MSEYGRQKIRFCTGCDGARIGFATCGTGPTLIAAAHWISHLRLDWDNPVRRGWLSMLSRAHTLIRYDARGTGSSDRDCTDFSLQRQIEDLEAIVEAAKCERFALLGLWTGGAVAINYAVRHPQRVTHLVLHACATRGRMVRDPGPEQVEEAKAQLKLIELGWGNENSAFRQLHTSQLMPDATAEQARAFNDLMRQTTTPANAAKLLQTHWTEADNRSLAPRTVAQPSCCTPGRIREYHSRKVDRLPRSFLKPASYRSRAGTISWSRVSRLGSNWSLSWTISCLPLHPCQITPKQPSSTTSPRARPRCWS